MEKNETDGAKKYVSSKNCSSYSSLDFGDFEFTIVNKQAIVQFTVDDQKISAFLEKENDKWKLVCAANIDEPI